MGYIFSDLPDRNGRLPYDLCNRLYKWSHLLVAARERGMRCAVDWYDSGYVTLPDTDRVSSAGRSISKFSLGELVSGRCELDPSKDYVESCGWSFDRTNKDYSLLKEVGMADCGLWQAARQAASGTVGVHVRRGDFKPATGLVATNTRLPDSYYFSAMDQAVSAVPDVTFYLASDGTPQELRPFFDRYGARLRSSSDVTRSSDKNLLKVVDLFALASCSYLVSSKSTYSMFASVHGDVPNLWPTDPNPTLDTDAFVSAVSRNR